MGALLSWLLARARDLWTLQAPVKVSLLQTALACIAGLWALHLYLVHREGQSSLRVDGAYRISQRVDHRLLFVRLRIANTASVVVRDAVATASLFRGEHNAITGGVDFHLVTQADPLLLANGDLVLGDEGPVTFEPCTGDLEPKECVNTEVLFHTDTNAGVLGLRVTVTGTQRRMLLRRTMYEWGWFALVDSSAEGRYTPLSISSIQ